jgi:hypothetical protein
MTNFMLSGSEQDVDQAWETWGDLLSSVDSNLEGSGLIVTDTRFDGVDEPTFRSAALMERRLEDFTEIAVETAEPMTLVNRSLDEASVALEALCEAARRVGASFRGHDPGSANRDLTLLTEGLGMLLSTFGTLGHVLDVDLENLSCDGQPFSNRVGAVSEALESLIAAHQTKDWVTVADVLEYDVEPGLHQWRLVVDALRPASTSDATETSAA